MARKKLPPTISRLDLTRCATPLNSKNGGGGDPCERLNEGPTEALAPPALMWGFRTASKIARSGWARACGRRLQKIPAMPRKLRDLSEDSTVLPELSACCKRASPGRSICAAALRQVTTAALVSQPLWAEESDWLLARLDVRWLGLGPHHTFCDTAQQPKARRRLGAVPESLCSGHDECFTRTRAACIPARNPQGFEWSRRGSGAARPSQMDAFALGGRGLDVNMLGVFAAVSCGHGTQAGRKSVIRAPCQHLWNADARLMPTVFSAGEFATLIGGIARRPKKSTASRPKRGHGAPRRSSGACQKLSRQTLPPPAAGHRSSLWFSGHRCGRGSRQIRSLSSGSWARIACHIHLDEPTRPKRWPIWSRPVRAIESLHRCDGRLRGEGPENSPANRKDINWRQGLGGNTDLSTMLRCLDLDPGPYRRWMNSSCPRKPPARGAGRHAPPISWPLQSAACRVAGWHRDRTGFKLTPPVSGRKRRAGRISTANFGPSCVAMIHQPS